MVRVTCITINVLAGITSFVLGVVSSPAAQTSHVSEGAFYALAGVFFIAAASGLFLRIRWLVVVPALPLLLGGILFALLIVADRSVWNAAHASQMTIFLLPGLGVAILETGTIFAARRMSRSKPPRPPTLS